MTCGILLLDKPLGVSSNGALQRVRRLLRADKAGHVGSLDPLATGMLPICLGEATKVAGDILAGRKRYRFGIALGARTATGDVEGAVIETLPVPAFDAHALEATLQRFRGRTTQVPPMYSALKRDGQPLYKLARAGIEVERAPREIEITELTLIRDECTPPASQRQTGVSSELGVDPRGHGLPPAGEAANSAPAWLELEVSCSKGTYIRVLAEDIARALGTCGHVAHLRRLSVEPFAAEAMQTLDAITASVERGESPMLIAADQAVAHLPAVSLSAAATAQARHGQAVLTAAEVAPGRVRLYDAAGGFIGIGEADGLGLVHPRRLFVAAP